MKESGGSGVLFVGFAFGRMPELAPHGLIEGLISREELSGVEGKSIFQISHEAIAPRLLRALIITLGSAGPVIST
jgi:hypothetical protein